MLLFLQETEPPPEPPAQTVQLHPDQVEMLGQMLSLNAGLLAFVILLLGGVLLIQIVRG